MNIETNEKKYSSKLYRFFDLLYRLLVINIMTIIVSLPIITMNPVLKYRGGKSRKLNKILEYIPNKFDRYIEPFFGGGALYFHLEYKNSIINDINYKLNNFYRDLSDNYLNLRQQLDELQEEYEKNQYVKKIAELYNLSINEVVDNKELRNEFDKTLTKIKKICHKLEEKIAYKNSKKINIFY